MIRLNQGPRGWDTPNLSPFCTKLEAYLRMAEIPYEAIEGDPRKAPKGKIPWIEVDGESIGDSSLIIDHLKRQLGDPLDARLSDEQHALGHAVKRMFEDARVRWHGELGG